VLCISLHHIVSLSQGFHMVKHCLYISLRFGGTSKIVATFPFASTCTRTSASRCFKLQNQPKSFTLPKTFDALLSFCLSDFRRRTTLTNNTNIMQTQTLHGKAVKTRISFSFRTVEGQAKSAVLFGTMWCGCTIDRALHKILTGKVFTKSSQSQNVIKCVRTHTTLQNLKWLLNVLEVD
jgi:hypothetical protein